MRLPYTKVFSCLLFKTWNYFNEGGKNYLSPYYPRETSDSLKKLANSAPVSRGNHRNIWLVTGFYSFTGEGGYKFQDRGLLSQVEQRWIEVTGKLLKQQLVQAQSPPTGAEHEIAV